MHALPRKFTIVLISLLTLIVVGAFGWLALQYVRIQRYQNLGDQAIEDGTWQVASFWYGKILDANPNHPHALRQMAHFSSLFLDKSEVFWWKRWHERFPDDSEIRLGYAEVLIRNGFFNDAKTVLDTTLPSTGQESKYHNLLTGYYLGIGDLQQAERFTRRSLDASPDSADLKLNLLNILLRKGNPDQMEEINRLMADIAAIPERLPDVWRVMLSYALSQSDHESAIALAQNLAQRDNATWREVAAYLKLIIYHRPESAPSELFVHTNPPLSLFEEVARSLIQAGQADLLLEWCSVLDTKSPLQGELSYRILIAEATASVSKWDELEALIANADWGVLNYYRHALLSRMHHHRGNATQSGKHWQDAVSQIQSSLQAARNLIQATDNWPAFESRQIALLEDMLQQSVHTEWAYQRLHSHYYARKATERLHQLSLRAHRVLPSNDNIRNNLIMYALLSGKDPASQLERAEALHEAYPGRPIPTTTYAFTLYMNQRYAEAWELMQKLDPRYFEIAEVAYYASLIATRAGGSEVADQLQDAALDATLLPEELALSQGVL